MKFKIVIIDPKRRMAASKERRPSENERCTTRRTVKKTAVVRNEPEVGSGFISDGGENLRRRVFYLLNR